MIKYYTWNNHDFSLGLDLFRVSLLFTLIYFGDLKKVALSLIYLGDSMLFDIPVLSALQAPIVGEVTPPVPYFPP